MSAPYLLHINSRPRLEAGINDALWVEWYTTEHIPDLINSKVAVNAAFYIESHDLKLISEHREARNFLAIYQTNLEEPLKSREYREGVRNSSDLFPQKKGLSDNGDFDGRNYELAHDYNFVSSKLGALPFIITIEKDPTDGEEIDKWCQEQHVELQNIPGYIRTLRYSIGPRNALSKTRPPQSLTIHGFEGWNEDKENQKASVSSWVKKVLEENRIISIRAWIMMVSDGY